MSTTQYHHAAELPCQGAGQTLRITIDAYPVESFCPREPIQGLARLKKAGEVAWVPGFAAGPHIGYRDDRHWYAKGWRITHFAPFPGIDVGAGK